MASELDDFFAKKEKKKKTKGKKFATTEEIVKTIDTTDSETADNTASVLEKTTSSSTKVGSKTAKHKCFEQLSDRPSVLCIKSLNTDMYVYAVVRVCFCESIGHVMSVLG